jgi:F-type H+-transporting ATPase subunit epsilon
MKTFFIDVYTPFGHYLKTNATFLEVQSEDYLLGIMAGHAPLVSTLVISKMVIEIDSVRYIYAIGGGIINISENGVILLLESVERSDEINLQRALEAQKRAEKRLSDLEDKTIDKNRAKLALARAINRIRLIQTDKS